MSNGAFEIVMAILVGWFVVMAVGMMIISPDHRPASTQPPLSEKETCLKFESDQPVRFVSARCLKHFQN